MPQSRLANALERVAASSQWSISHDFPLFPGVSRIFFNLSREDVMLS
jgi:hypothetical protein